LIVLAGGGAALITAGFVRYLTRDSGATSRGVGMVPTSSGGFVTWTGRF
jgi:hypothetical protein